MRLPDAVLRQICAVCGAFGVDGMRADLVTSMKARDAVRTRTIRMTLTAITNEEVAGAAARELSDTEIVKVLIREAKKRREAAEAFETGGRPQQAAAVIAQLRKADPENAEVLYAAYRTYTDLAGESMLALSLAAPGL